MYSFFLKKLVPAIFIVFSNSVFSQEVLEEIIVTADYRQANVNDISGSISVINTELIEKRNALHLEDILLNTPNVNFASGASRARFIQIRGIGERGQFSEPLNSSVGVLIDGVDFSGAGNAAMLYDLEQVEILMGPQGTRYGSNALAGLVNLKSKEASDSLTYGIQVQAGNYNSKGYAGYVSGPATDDLFFRLSGQILQSDGYSYNQFLDRPTNQRHEKTLRGKFFWQIDNNNSLEFISSLIDLDNGYDAFSLDNNRDTLSDEPGFDKQDSTLASLRFKSDSFSHFQLEALAGFAKSDIAYGYDEDWVYDGFHPFGYTSTDYYFRDRETSSGELRLVSTDEGALFNNSTDWVVGVYHLHQAVGLDRQYTFLANVFNSQFEIDRLAFFADTSTQLISDKLSFDLGLRTEQFKASYNDSSLLTFNPKNTLNGGRVSLNYHPDNGNLFYISASRGYKTGGFNTDGSLDADLREFGEEALWNYEAGFKGSFIDAKLQARLALFTMERDDVQISSSMVRTRPDGSSEFIDFIGNAASGRNTGIELDLNYSVSDRFGLYGNLGLLDTEYEDFINSAGLNLDGREQAHAPGHQYTIGTQIRLLTGLTLDINIQGRDSFYFSDSHDAQSDKYTLVNASLNYRRDNLNLTLWGRNLTDEDYKVRGFFFGNDPRDNYTGKAYTQFGEPAVFGVTVNIDY